MHWDSPLAQNVAAQVAGELKMVANQVHLLKNGFTTSIKWVYYIHKRKNNTIDTSFYLFCVHQHWIFTSFQWLVLYPISLSFSGSHSTSRFLCHFQYLILHPGFSVIFSISYHLQVSLSFSVPHSSSRFLCLFQYLILHPGFFVVFSGWTCAWTWCHWWGRHGLVRHIVPLTTSLCLQTANCDAYSPWSRSPQIPRMTMVSLQF